MAERVHGPYKHRHRWRVVVVRADGRQTVESFATRAEADAVAAAARAQVEGRTLVAAVDAFEVSLRERGLASASVERSRSHLESLLQLATNGHRPLRWLTARRAQELYDAVQVGRATDTHRNALAAGKAWAKWARRRGWLVADPFADVVPVGRRRRGKPQLHVDEARRLLDACIQERSAASLGVALALLLGLRASEVAHRQVRDLDDAGRLLWVPKGKTAAARRCLEVPEVLRAPLRELAAGRPAEGWLFSDSERPSRHWTLYHVRRLCRAAGVPEVCAHGLRGTYATIATSAGQPAHAVAAALGHASPSMTDAAYVAPGERAAAERRAALKVLSGGRG